MIINEEEILNAYQEDYKYFGNDTKFIYEDIYSALYGSPVSFSSVDSLIKEDLPLDLAGGLNKSLGSPGIMNLYGLGSKAVNPFNKVPDLSKINMSVSKMSDKVIKDTLAGNNPTGLSFFAKLGQKVKGFFGNLKSTPLPELLKKGFSWVVDPANATKVLGSAGGLVLLIMIIKSLKKRGQLKKYGNLVKFDNKINGINDDYDPEFEAARRQVLQECEINPRLRKALSKKDNFNY